MTTASHNTMLRELGYITGASGISQFQRDYNRIGTQPVLITGELDEPSREALELAHSTRDMFSMLRDQQGRGKR
jgi:hypothetical protein